MGPPRITVLMPVWNGGAYLPAAIRSVIGQTFADLELLVVDDGSTDDSVAVARAFDDPRIRVLGPSEHRGVAATLNRGLDAARGALVARMDADDVSLPNRLARQAGFLDAHPEVGLCGAWARTLGPDPAPLVTPTEPDRLAASLFFGNSLVHPSVVLRTSVLKAHALCYDPGYNSAEDYELWARMASVTRLATVPEVLVLLRTHAAQASIVRAPEMRAAGGRVLTRQLRRLIPDAGEADAAFHRQWLDADGRVTPSSLVDAARWAARLVAANETARAFPAVPFRRRVSLIQRRRLRRAIADDSGALISTVLRAPRLGPWAATEAARWAVGSGLRRANALLRGGRR